MSDTHTASVPIADDQQRLNAIIDGMASYLDRTLRLNDPGMQREDLHWKRDAGLASIERARAGTLAGTLHEEARYMPDTAQLDYIEALNETAVKAERAEKLASELMEVCDNMEDLSEGRVGGVSETGAIALAPYARWWAYYHFTEIDTSCGLVVGGMGRMLKDRIALIAEDWLRDCDRVLCMLHETVSIDDADMSTLIAQLARDIAKRVTLHNTTSPFAQVDKLEPDSLGARNEIEFTRTRVDAQCQARNDMRALRALQVLTCEPMSREAKVIFDSQLPLLQMVVSRPPQELGLVGENARRMNLSLLSRCLMPGMDAACRMHIANGWANRHGAWAQTAIAEAIRRLEGFSPKESAHFIRVATHGRGATLMPTMPWAPWASAWYAIPPPSGPATRTGLDEKGERIVRLGSFVWQLVGEGAFEQGVMSATVVSEVAFECLQLARLGRELIDHERMRSNVGVRLLSFNESISNRSSELAHSLDVAQCCLSHFSLRDINDVFHPHKPLLERVYGELGRRTRLRLGNKRTPLVPAEYETFVGDALALLLPAIETRRMMIHLPHSATPHPLGDMLRTVTKCCTWTPLDGKCRLELADLRHAHPSLRGALEHYAQKGGDFVKAPHIGVKAKVVFEFESAPLLQLLKM